MQRNGKPPGKSPKPFSGVPLRANWVFGYHTLILHRQRVDHLRFLETGVPKKLKAQLKKHSEKSTAKKDTVKKDTVKATKD